MINADIGIVLDTIERGTPLIAPAPKKREPDELSVEEREKLFRDLVSGYGRALHYFVLRHVGNETEAADIAQQALAEAAISIKSFRGESGVSTWVFGIATNLARNYLNRAPHRRYVFESPDVLDEHKAPDNDPCDQLERQQTIAALSAAIDKLPPNMSSALMLVAMDGLSYEEAAQRLGIPLGTVRSRVSRARALIREQLRKAGCGIGF
jgi:RNA polymerase sigma factor (sigma-70 family)